MTGKEREYVDVTKQDSGMPDVETPIDQKPMSKAEDALAESSRAHEDEGAPPPLYSESAAEPANSNPASASPPHYLSISDEVSADVKSLSVGDPKEVIAVPMIHSTETVNFKKLFSKGRKTVTQTVIVRKMPREHYLKHYAKDAEGNYVGTEKRAVDAGLVFVPSKSTPEDILQQVHKVAFGKEHHNSDFSAGMTMIPFMMNTGGSGG